MRRSRIAALSVTAALAVSGGMAANAGASFHLMKVTEVHQGVLDAGDYVELQMYEAGQNLVGGHYVRSYDGGGTAFSSFPIPSNVANGQNQRTILIANDATVAGADFDAAGNLKIVNANGGLCFLDTALDTTPIDCVSWGAQAGTQPWGTPLALPAGTIPDNSSIVRTHARGCATALDVADDTNNSSADFALGASTPRGNAVTPTETLCATPAKKCKKKKKKKGKVKVAAKKKKGCKKKKRRKK